MTTPTQITDTLKVALFAQRQELDARNDAWAQGNLEDMQAHYQAYQSASDVVHAAQKAAEGNILSNPDALHGLDLLTQANAKLKAAAASLKSATTSLGEFTSAANVIIQILAVIAVI